MKTRWKRLISLNGEGRWERCYKDYWFVLHYDSKGSMGDKGTYSLYYKKGESELEKVGDYDSWGMASNKMKDYWAYYKLMGKGW